MFEDSSSPFWGEVILITGAGTIGNLLGSYFNSNKFYDGIKKLYIIDNNEMALKKFSMKYPGFHTILGDITDENLMADIFKNISPNIVYHTAAIKHVDLNENNPIYAEKVNVQGTKNLVFLSKKNSIEKFIFISSDKAQNPINVLGRTKLSAEKIVIENGYTSLRFPNILGSSGSLLERYKEIGERKGTLHYNDCERYFISKEDAIDFIINCTSLDGGKIYVTDKGLSSIDIKKIAEIFQYIYDCSIVKSNKLSYEKDKEEYFDKETATYVKKGIYHL